MKYLIVDILSALRGLPSLWVVMKMINTTYFVTIGNDDVTIDKMFTSGAYVKAAMTCSRCLKSWTWDNHDDRVIYNCTLSGTILFTGQIPAKIHRLETNGCIISCIKTQNYFKWPNKIDFSTILEIIFTLWKITPDLKTAVVAQVDMHTIISPSKHITSNIQ